jgi:hypothetical protein
MRTLKFIPQLSINAIRIIASPKFAVVWRETVIPLLRGYVIPGPIKAPPFSISLPATVKAPPAKLLKCDACVENKNGAKQPRYYSLTMEYDPMLPPLILVFSIPVVSWRVPRSKKYPSLKILCSFNKVKYS